MSVHDEIMTALCRVEMGEGWDESRFGWRHHADALLPIVERVARNTIEAYKRSGLSCAAQECKACQGAIDAIVAGVMEGGQ